MNHHTSAATRLCGLGCLATCLVLFGAEPAAAGLFKFGRRAKWSPPSQSAVQIPMNDTDSAAPYAARFKITGFLARQHARDGDVPLALTEFRAMLNVDDPSWPTNPHGDSLRIARDRDVAQMMAESGFFQESVRVLDTALILARVDNDPQAAELERQIAAIVELAQDSGVVVQAREPDGATLAAAEQPSKQLRKAAPARRSAESAPVRQVNTAEPRVAPSVAPAHEVVADAGPAQPETVQVKAEQPKPAAPARAAAPPVLQAAPSIPAIPAKTIQAPAATHSVAESEAGTAPRSHEVTEGGDEAEPETPTESVGPAATAPLEQSDEVSRVSEPSPAEATTASTEPVSERSAEPAVPADSSIALASYESPGRQRDTQVASSKVVAAELKAPQPVLGTHESHEARPERSAIGVAGQVARRGIFKIDGPSASLAAVLRRADGLSNLAGKQARILRSAEIRGSSAPSRTQRDFYCQRVDLSRASEQELATPVYAHEIVIVDGPGDQPLYVAVMPYFILQLPLTSDRPMTARQIVETLEAFWPNIHDQEAGVITRLANHDGEIPYALHPGDLLYIDGRNLDRSQVRAAAEAVARLAGVKVRTPEPGVAAAATPAR